MLLSLLVGKRDVTGGKRIRETCRFAALFSAFAATLAGASPSTRQPTRPMSGITQPPGAVCKNRLILTHHGPTECLPTAKILRAG